MKLRRNITCGEYLPKYYGYAWDDHSSRYIVCYPLGIHLIAMAAYRVWQLKFWCPRSRLEKLINHTRHVAFTEGRLQGYEEGSDAEAADTNTQIDENNELRNRLTCIEAIASDSSIPSSKATEMIVAVAAGYLQNEDLAEWIESLKERAASS